MKNKRIIILSAGCFRASEDGPGTVSGFSSDQSEDLVRKALGSDGGQGCRFPALTGGICGNRFNDQSFMPLGEWRLEIISFSFT